METIWTELAALGGVILIDVALAADNAVVVGLAAAGLPAHQRRNAILIGIGAAAGLRIVFALIATQLLDLGWGLLVAGGLLLVWVAWKLFREIQSERRHAREAREHAEQHGIPVAPTTPQPKTLRQAIIQITLADVSMSLDNVLAVAGLARDHTWVLVVGLTLSVALMGIAATFIVGLLKRFPWLSVLGLLVIVFVAGKMIYEGVHEAVSHEPETPVIETTVEPVL
ncbi:MAG: YjbE family putative metal transport protein [Bauldia sp.]|nr:YjbE family putative metal transport protein [Bauldia sp.]